MHHVDRFKFPLLHANHRMVYLFLKWLPAPSERMNSYSVPAWTLLAYHFRINGMQCYNTTDNGEPHATQKTTENHAPGPSTCRASCHSRRRCVQW